MKRDSGAKPNASIAAWLVDTATKWRLTAASPSSPTSHSRAEFALLNVSSVVNVFEQITNSVVAGLTCSITSASSTPSMFDTQ